MGGLLARHRLTALLLACSLLQARGSITQSRCPWLFHNLRCVLARLSC